MADGEGLVMPMSVSARSCCPANVRHVSVQGERELLESMAVDRLTLVSEVQWFYLREPTFVRPGQTFWIDVERHMLCVNRGNGRITRHGFVTEYTGDMRR
jgi:hypothetical protein